MIPSAPKPKEAVRVPSPNDPDIKAAAMAKTEEEFAAKRGRRSTNLTGANAYSRTTLG
jgi:hypothetical protein